MSNQGGEQNEPGLTLESYLEEARANLGETPSDGKLLAYHRGALDGEEADRIQEHIAVDPEVAARFDEMASFPSKAKPGAPDYLSDEELETHWRRFRDRLPVVSAVPAPAEADVLDFDPERLRQRMRRTRDMAVVAALVGLVAGFGWWNRSREVSRLRAAIAGPEGATIPEPITQFYRGTISGFDPFRSESPSVPSLLPAGHDLYLLTLALEPGPEPRPVGRLRLEIWPADAERSEESAPLWQQEDVRPTARGAVDVLIPGTFLEPGRYELDLLDPEDERALVARFLISI